MEPYDTKNTQAGIVVENRSKTAKIQAIPKYSAEPPHTGKEKNMRASNTKIIFLLFVAWFLVSASLGVWNTITLKPYPRPERFIDAGTPSQEAYACYGRKGLWSCSKNEAARESLISILVGPVVMIIGMPVFTMLFLYDQPGKVWLLWFHPGAMLFNPYVFVAVFFVLIKGTQFLMGKWRKNRFKNPSPNPHIAT